MKVSCDGPIRKRERLQKMISKALVQGKWAQSDNYVISPAFITKQIVPWHNISTPWEPPASLLVHPYDKTIFFASFQLPVNEPDDIFCRCFFFSPMWHARMSELKSILENQFSAFIYLFFAAVQTVESLFNAKSCFFRLQFPGERRWCAF